MSSWDELGRETRTRLDDVVEQLKLIWPDLWSSVGSYSTEVYPLNAFASLNTSGPPHDEDVVLFAAVQAADASITFSSDISEGDGNILAEGPTDNWEPGIDLEEQLACARAALDQFFAFIETSMGLITTQLHAKAQS